LNRLYLFGVTFIISLVLLRGIAYFFITDHYQKRLLLLQGKRKSYYKLASFSRLRFNFNNTSKLLDFGFYHIKPHTSSGYVCNVVGSAEGRFKQEINNILL